MGTGLGILLRKLTGGRFPPSTWRPPLLYTPSVEEAPAVAAEAHVAAAPVETVTEPPAVIEDRIAKANASELGARLTKYKCFDFEMYLDPDDRTAWPIVNLGVYEHHVLPVFRDVVQPGMNVLDIGANIGVYSVAAGLKGARVTAIDASGENCKLISVNAKLNNVAVKVLPFAVSDEPGMALFGRTSESCKWVNPQAQLSIETFDSLEAACAVSLDSVLGDEHFDVVKIDIDGREYAALKGANKLFSRRPIFFMEYAQQLTKPGSGVEPQELLKLFTERGYKMTVIGMRGPSIDVGNDIAAVDRIAKAEWDEAGITLVDLLMRPA